jgi:hypothetical protein
MHERNEKSQINSAYVIYKGRKIMIALGIPFYATTGTNTSDAFKDTWFPFMGVTQNQMGVHSILRTSTESEHRLVKPVHENFVRTDIQEEVSYWITDLDEEALKSKLKEQRMYCGLIFKKSNSASEQAICYVIQNSKIIKTENFSNLPLSTPLPSDFLKKLTREEADIVRQKYFLVKGQQKEMLELPIFQGIANAQELVERFCDMRLLAISASIGGGIWDSENGKKTKEILQENFPEYFRVKYLLNEDRPLGDSSLVNKFIADHGGYLADANFINFFDRVENSTNLINPLIVLHAQRMMQATQLIDYANEIIVLIAATKNPEFKRELIDLKDFLLEKAQLIQEDPLNRSFVSVIQQCINEIEKVIKLPSALVKQSFFGSIFGSTQPNYQASLERIKTQVKALESNPSEMQFPKNRL